MFGWSSGVEPPHALLKEPWKGGFGITIEFPQMPFGLVPKVLYAIDMPALRIDSFMVVVDSFVFVPSTNKVLFPPQESEKEHWMENLSGG